MKIRDFTLAALDSLVIIASFFTFAVIFFNYASDTYKIIFGGNLPLVALAVATWLILGYTAELYAPRPFTNYLEFKKNLIITSAIWLLILVASGNALFLEAPGKTAAMLIVTLTLTVATKILWLETGNKIFFKQKVIFLGASPTLDALGRLEPIANLRNGLSDELYPRLNIIIEREKIDAVIVADNLTQDARAMNQIIDFIVASRHIISASDFYESIFQKIAVDEISPDWILKNTARGETFITRVCGLISRLLALIIFILLLPLIALISLAIIFTSPGPAFIHQTRVGRFGKTFILHKFRSMRADAERAGAQWAAEIDTRVTPLGRLLRATHLDELPQLWNIAMGELAFIGPRPERPELIGPIKKTVPLFDLRLLAKPGLTGWAQINYHYGRSVDDAREKLAYDLYYLKNHSIWLDLKILLRTAKHFIA